MFIVIYSLFLYQYFGSNSDIFLNAIRSTSPHETFGSFAEYVSLAVHYTGLLELRFQTNYSELCIRLLCIFTPSALSCYFNTVYMTMIYQSEIQNNLVLDIFI
jgi:hypothetical protein